MENRLSGGICDVSIHGTGGTATGTTIEAFGTFEAFEAFGTTIGPAL